MKESYPNVVYTTHQPNPAVITYSDGKALLDWDENNTQECA